MNTLIQNLQDAKDREEAANGFNEILEAIHANPGEWVKIILAAAKEISETTLNSDEYRYLICRIDTLEDTIENRARLWDMYRRMVNNDNFRWKLDKLLSEAYFCSDSIPENYVFS